jgi:uncharacterized protein (TIGR04255 family)
METLTDDPIVEALLEIRFETPELPELVVGRLSDLGPWRDAKKLRLPFAEVPSQLRSADQNLRFQPTIEVQGAAGFGAVRVGGNVISLHLLRPYPGWESAYPRFCTCVEEMFAAIPNLSVSRIGLRYINAFSRARHHVGRVGDLAIQLEVAGEAVTRPINLTMLYPDSDRFVIQTRVVAPEYLSGNVPDGTTAVVDIDVFTPPRFASSSLDDVRTWVNEAHTKEKGAFRQLLPDALYETLRKKRDHAASH